MLEDQIVVETYETPNGELSLRTVTMPEDTNPRGAIFGGWVLSQMDMAGAILAIKRAQGPVVTVGVDAMSFIRPVHVGNVVST